MKCLSLIYKNTFFHKNLFLKFLLQFFLFYAFLSFLIFKIFFSFLLFNFLQKDIDEISSEIFMTNNFWFNQTNKKT